MTYNNTYTTPKYWMKEDEKLERYNLVSELKADDPTLAWISQIPDIFYNPVKYPNSFFNDIITVLRYLNKDFNEKPETKKLYETMMMDLERGAKKIMESPEYQQQQAYAAQVLEYQQQLLLQQQQYGQQQYGYPQGQQGGYQQGQQQYNNYPQQQYNPQGQQYNNYSQNYQGQQSYPAEGAQTYPNENNYQGQYDANQQQPQTYHKNQRRHQGQQEHKNDRRDHRKRQFHQKTQIHPKYQEDMIAEEQTQPEPKYVEPTPPPKPEPKPTKFSITQIKDIINSYSSQDKKVELEAMVNPEVLNKVKEISAWKTDEVEVKLKDDPIKFSKKDSRRDGGDNQRDNNNKNSAIKFGIRKDEAKQAERLGYKKPDEIKVQIVVGAKETIETRQMKEEIKKKAIDFASQKMEEDKGLDKIVLSKKEIIYNLNLIVPENLRDVEKDLYVFLFDSEEVCRVLIEQVIKKAWDQPKYASTYARLCYDFSKKPISEFKFEPANKKEKDNPFKHLLVDRVQHSFDEKQEKNVTFENAEERELYLSNTKKKILSNVKFIAELILCKILKKMIIKYCISQLFHFFLTHFYTYKQTQQPQDSFYDFHYEAVIEFIENIGQRFDSIDEKEKDSEQNFEIICKHVLAILQLKEAPQPQILKKIQQLAGDQYFNLLAEVNQTFMKINHPRLSALLQNLVERRNHKWQKHLSAADGPKKLKEIQDDIAQEEQGGAGKSQEREKANRARADQEKLDKKVKELFQGWQGDKKHELRDLKDILRNTSAFAFYQSFLKQIADQKKDLVIKRVELFPILTEKEFFSPKEFKKAWFDSVKYMAFGSGDFPFVGAAYAKIFMILVNNKVGTVQNFYQKLEDEDEAYFMDEVLQKYHHYSGDELATKFIKPKTKYFGMI